MFQPFKAFTACLFALGAPTLAQAAPSQTESEIVVTGERIWTPAEIRKEARSVTRDGNLRGAPLARFEKAVCPATVGLPIDLAGPLIRRVREVASLAGLREAPSATCTPNVIIAFTGDGASDLAKMAETKGSLLSGLDRGELEDLLDQPGPARAFSAVAMKDNNGMPVLEDPPVIAVTWASRLALPIRYDLELAVVVIDADAADGLTIGQLADYAAMRTFARTLPADGDFAGSTILGLFSNDAAPPQGMTAFDMAYLKSLYRGPPNQPGIRKISNVSSLMGSASEE